MKRALACNRGAAAVEFALTASIFFTLLFAIIEFSRLMLLWGTASEATRMAARMASVCSPGAITEQAARKRVASLLNASGQVSINGRTDWLSLTYLPSGCTESTCTLVTARIANVSAKVSIPGVQQTIILPDFSASSPREAMLSTINSTQNNACI